MVVFAARARTINASSSALPNPDHSSDATGLAVASSVAWSKRPSSGVSGTRCSGPTVHADSASSAASTFSRSAMAGALRGEARHAALVLPHDQLAQHDIEHRREEEAEEGHAQHSGHYRDAHDVPHLGAGAGGEHQRRDAGDEGEARHEDRAQPQPAGLDGGVHDAAALLLEIARELDDQ